MATRIILVEDDEVLRQGLADYLRLAGLNVTDVASGIEFYRALRKEQFDVAILDVNLPDTTGFELARDLRADHHMGIIILTARTGRADRLQAYQDGADIFLNKPVDGAELALAIRNLADRMRQGRQQDAAPVASEDASWRLDVPHQRLTAPDATILALTPRESMLLELLADARGSVISRASIEAILGYADKSPGGRGLDATVRRLRAKAEAIGIDLPVQNVHALGLRFTATIDKI